MSHPLESISPATRSRAFIWLLLATVLLFFAFRFIGPDKPNIVEYELAGSNVKSQAIIDAWSPVDRLHAGFSLGIDYLFMPLYSTTIALALIWAASVLTSKRWRSIGIALAWGLWLAAIFDALENLALIKILFDTTAIDPWPQIAATCATIKFTLIVIGLIYAIVGVTARLINRNQSFTNRIA
jgi:hypothetical protein